MASMFSSPAMHQFIQNIATFPTVIFTGLVMFVTLYWLVALLGLVDFDDGLGGDDLSHHSHGHSEGEQGDIGFFSSLLMRFGLQGVPLLIILTLFSLIGWLLSYFNVALLQHFFTQGTTLTLIATLTLIPIAIVSLALTGMVVAPIRKRLAPSVTPSSHTLLGEVATVRTMTVDDKHGEAVLDDGGAGLILKVRAFDTTFVQGDNVILVEYLSESNAYRVKGVS